jgi:hypothetical protein
MKGPGAGRIWLRCTEMKVPRMQKWMARCRNERNGCMNGVTRMRNEGARIRTEGTRMRNEGPE